MVVMVTCNNCGHEYKSEVLQTPDEETLREPPLRYNGELSQVQPDFKL